MFEEWVGKWVDNFNSKHNIDETDVNNVWHGSMTFLPYTGYSLWFITKLPLLVSCKRKPFHIAMRRKKRT